MQKKKILFYCLTNTCVKITNRIFLRSPFTLPNPIPFFFFFHQDRLSVFSLRIKKKKWNNRYPFSVNGLQNCNQIWFYVDINTVNEKSGNYAENMLSLSFRNNSKNMCPWFKALTDNVFLRHNTNFMASFFFFIWTVIRKKLQ